MDQGWKKTNMDRLRQFFYAMHVLVFITTIYFSPLFLNRTQWPKIIFMLCFNLWACLRLTWKCDRQPEEAEDDEDSKEQEFTGKKKRNGKGPDLKAEKKVESEEEEEEVEWKPIKKAKGPVTR
ncbi:hypothetical protein EG329_003711 [Mollisiaceae sp. DMI_Dod_QoI]|nr:hypothetical protein EG329_003711 [Helotiales sp. DMI_Dod_QoI]